MHFLHINSEKDSGKIDKIIKRDNDVFILIYMEGCGPCNATRPEWAKIEGALQHQYGKNDNLYVVDINKDYMSNIKKIGDVDGFPSLKYFGKHGDESYETSAVKKKDRSVNSFVEWIEGKINHMVSTAPMTSSSKNLYKRLTKHKKMKGGRKWTRKYKKSINCKRPRGFSQKQYCKYGRKNRR